MSLWAYGALKSCLERLRNNKNTSENQVFMKVAWSQWHILLKDFGIVGSVVVRGQMDTSVVAVTDPRQCWDF